LDMHLFYIFECVHFIQTTATNNPNTSLSHDFELVPC
jgi:hypothetical protein